MQGSLWYLEGYHKSFEKKENSVSKVEVPGTPLKFLDESLPNIVKFFFIQALQCGDLILQNFGGFDERCGVRLLSTLLAQVADLLDVRRKTVIDFLKFLPFLSAITCMLKVSIWVVVMFRHSVTHPGGAVTELAYQSRTVTPVAVSTRVP